MTCMHSSHRLRPHPPARLKRRNLTLVTDPDLEPAERLLIAVFRQARLDLFSKSGTVRRTAERFLAAYGYDIEGIRAAWAGKRQK